MSRYEKYETLAQQVFVAEQKRYRRRIAAGRFLLLFLLLALWEISADTGLLNDFIFSSPSRMLSCFVSMTADGSIFVHMGVTLFETLVSFVLVVLLGLSGAMLLWASRTVSDLLEPYLVMLNSLPKSALAPLLIVWLGATRTTIIVAGMSVAIFGSILNLYTSFMTTDPGKMTLIYTLGGKHRDVLTKVVLPSSIPAILSNMKVNIGLCLVGVVIGEFLAAREGLGYLIIYSSQIFQMNVLLMSIVLLCIMAMGLYAVVSHWGRG